MLKKAAVLKLNTELAEFRYLTQLKSNPNAHVFILMT